MLVGGPVTITATQDLGSLGPHRSEPIEVTCSRLAGLPAVLPWIVIGMLLIWQTTRDRRASAVLAPLVALYLVWSIIRQILPFDSWEIDHLAQQIGDVSAGLAAVWLLLPHLRYGRRLTTFATSLFIAIVVSLLPGAAESSTAQNELTILRMLSAAVAILAICAAPLLARICARRGELGRGFVVWLAAWLFALTFIGVLTATAGFLLIEDRSFHFFLTELGRISIFGLVISATVHLIVLPFLILAAGSSFHRRRLEEYLEIPRHPLPPFGVRA